MNGITPLTRIVRDREQIARIWLASPKATLPVPLHGDTFPYLYVRERRLRPGIWATLRVEQETKTAPIIYLLTLGSQKPVHNRRKEDSRTQKTE